MWKLKVGVVEMAEKTSREIEESSSESDNESTPPLPHTSAAHPTARAAANEENDYVIRVSLKRKFENNETSKAKKLKTMPEIGNQSKPATYSYIVRMLGPRGEGPGNQKRIKMSERSNQRSDEVKPLEKNENPAEEHEEDILETHSDSTRTQLCRNCLKDLQIIEKRLVYTNEDISFEFGKPLASTSTLSASDGSTLPSGSKLFEMNLKEACACCRQKNYSAAVEYFLRALEVWG